MKTYHELEEEMNNVPGRYKRPEKDAFGKMLPHVYYWSREDDHAVWRKIKNKELTGKSLQIELAANWALRDEFGLPKVKPKKLSHAKLRKEQELVTSAKVLEEEALRAKEDADITKGLGFRDMRTDLYWTHSEWAEEVASLEIRRQNRIKLDSAQVKTSEEIAHDKENIRLIAECNQRETLQSVHERDVRARESSIETLLNWTEEDIAQRDESRATYIAFCEKHFGHITHFCDTPVVEYNINRVKELLQTEYNTRFDTIDITKLSRQERIAHKDAIEKSVDERETEGKIKGVIWVKDKNRWRVYIDSKHYGYYTTQLLAIQRAQEIRLSGL